MQCSITEIGDGLGALVDGMLGELSWEDQAHSCLKLGSWQGLLLVFGRELTSFFGEPFEHLVHELIEEVDGVLWDPVLRRHLLEYAIDVALEPFPSIFAFAVFRSAWLAWQTFTSSRSKRSFGERGIVGCSSGGSGSGFSSLLCHCEVCASFLEVLFIIIKTWEWIWSVY